MLLYQEHINNLMQPHLAQQTFQLPQPTVMSSIHQSLISPTNYHDINKNNKHKNNNNNPHEVPFVKDIFNTHNILSSPKNKNEKLPMQNNIKYNAQNFIESKNKNVNNNKHDDLLIKSAPSLENNLNSNTNSDLNIQKVCFS